MSLSSAHFENETYSDTKGFEERNERNRDVIGKELAPALNALGLSVILASADKDAVPIPEALEDKWLDFRGPNPFRPPDLLCFNPWGPCPFLFVEFKHFPVMQLYPCTGFHLKHLRVYLACQHHMGVPVLVLFRDLVSREKDGKLGEGYRSAFIRDGKEHFYGGLLADLDRPHLTQSFKYDDQIRWYSQEDLQDRGTPVMRTLEEIVGGIRAGGMSKREIPPGDLAYWGLIQNKCREHGFAPMREPGKLVVFSVKK
jgi:hypothetical protein